ncbi:hypothetical protein LAZ67_5001520 [Cordylochernes scorpioides]|uniref:ATP-dependent DNA helicase n=1 Tax=Cordylochernes scorpioides TaxID=51811 RepID=A0ABY6KFQ3_9ARAC|nr:hypothetical protein LAZ67_5001520 [Cordylochernes scorpioides]
MTQTLPLWKNGKEDEQLDNHVLSDVDIEEPAPDTMINRQTESSESDRPQRTRTIPKRFDDYVLATTNETIPKDYEEAIACEDKKHWENAMLEEIQNMYSHQVWELVPRPVNAKVVKSKWVFKISKDQENKTYKARLVAMGYYQIPGRDYNESFSPVIKNATLRTILSMAATKDSVIKLFDVKAAYLNGNIENTIFMEQPAGFVQDRNKVCKLNKSIYGLPQSGRSWYEKFSQVLHDCGLEKLKSDPCLFKWKNEDKYFYVGIYVDDFITVSDSEDTSNRFINKLRHHLEIKDVTCKGMFLGIKIIQDKEGISLQQSHYVQQILQKYGMETCKEVPTPGSKEINLDNHIEDDNCEQHTYQEALGMLMFLAVNTRPDIAYITGKLSQYSKQPKQIHWTAIKRVMRYLRGTIDLGVKFERGKTGILKSYADASWSTTHDGKSYGGYVLKLGEATIDWKSSKQPLVALSTMEAEMIAACESCCQIKWIINLLRELGEWNFMEKPTAIYTDSQSLINWISSPKQSSRYRHINRKYHFLRDCYESRDICLLYKPSQDLVADIFTKDLSRDQMKKHLESLSIVGIKPRSLPSIFGRLICHQTLNCKTFLKCHEKRTTLEDQPEMRGKCQPVELLQHPKSETHDGKLIESERLLQELLQHPNSETHDGKLIESERLLQELLQHPNSETHDGKSNESERLLQGLLQHPKSEMHDMRHNAHARLDHERGSLLKKNVRADDMKVIIRADKTPTNEHERRFNAPMTPEVAAVIVGTEIARRDIVICRRDGTKQRVAETHRSYDALQYPILFPRGEDGYHLELYQVHPISGAVTMKKVSCMDFYAYRIMIRAQESNHILKCRQLFQQFIVDMYAKVESERLNYIRFNQSKLRADQYIHLRDAIANDGAAAAANIGQMVILPASYAGSPRHMHEYAQDAMTYVRTYGRPDLFLTFTCNPAWAEIKNLLLPGQQSSHRHDLTARVFKQKLKCFIDLIVKNHIYGPTRCWMYSIEWQKRGTPHAHILIWLEEKILPTQIDNIISAELPDPQEDPELYQIIKKYMIHGPCGAQNPHSPCIKDGKCTKKYPRDLVHDTQTGGDGYPLYRRRKPEDGGHTATIKLNHVGFEVDNRWIVPYSPLLSKAFDAHINVEYCNSVKSIKYICKYVNKGSDMAVFGLQNPNAPVNEIDQFQMGRYISSNEAVWRILGFDIHERSPAVVHLSVHLENGQRVYFTEESAAQRAENPPNTTLTAFFQLCASDTFAATLLYHEVPTYYTWNQSTKKWQRRKQGMLHSSMVQVFSTGALGRVYTVHPSNAECYYLRMLLHVVKGPQSFEAIKTVNGQICQTYREACFKLGLLENDQHWDNTLAEASETCHPKQIRTLFAIILTTCSPSDPKGLWEKHKEITEHVRTGNGGLLFLDAPGGTGKTFLLNLILAEIRMKHEIALAVASSGIAATLLDGGRTAHSAFKLPLNLNIADVPLCNIGKTSGMATVLKTCQIIIWDECTMAHKKALEALDRTLRDFRGNQPLMGGALILLAGDFRQILPVIPRATPADELNTCLKKSALWRHVKKITLSTNMRVHLHGDVSAQTFAKQLLNMGDGKKFRLILQHTRYRSHRTSVNFRRQLEILKR